MMHRRSNLAHSDAREQEAREKRFQEYMDMVVAELGHADREEPALLYLKGLMLPGGRKSVEPMAARLRPEATDQTRQAMGHFVSASPWKDDRVMRAVENRLIPELHKPADPPPFLILDDTGHPKKGDDSVGVARQFFGLLGKVDNCQVAVSLSFATERGSIPIGYRLYLPEDEWANDRERRKAAKVPENIRFQTKNEIGSDLLRAAMLRGVPSGIVLGDTSYGDNADFRDELTAEGRPYALAVREHTTVWWGGHQPAMPEPQKRGRPRTRLLRDEDHQPISVSDLARQLPASKWKTIRWREGTNGTLSSRFARVRARAAHDNKDRKPEWLVIEWPGGSEEPEHFFLSTLPKSTPFKELVQVIKGRWRIERDYQELKSELGLSDFEGRSWRGFHHHATICIAAYGFLLAERLRETQDPDLDMKNLPFPKPPAPGARGGRMQRHVPWSMTTLRRRIAAAIAVEIISRALNLDIRGRAIVERVASLVMNL